MSRFTKFFKGTRPKSSSETKAKVKRSVNKIDIKIRKYQTMADEQQKVAYQLLQSGNKVAATQALKRREYYMRQISSAYAQIANLQRTIDTIDTSETSVDVVEVMTEAADTIDKNLGLDQLEKAEEAMMKLEESIEASSEMDEILTDTSITDIGMDTEVDDRISNQLAQMEAQMTSSALPSTKSESSSFETSSLNTSLSSGGENDSKKALDELDKIKKQLEEGLK